MSDALAAAAGLELGAYRARHVEERVGRALRREGVEDVAALTRLLRSDPRARSRFRRSVAVSVSGLFRDPHQFALLEQEILPALLLRPGRMTVWSAGCADGTELYSVALLLDRAGALDRSTLLGSDVLEENLERARSGPLADARIPERLRRRLRWEVRDLLRNGPPPGRWRLVLCRNVAIYLAPEARRNLHRCLVSALAAGGVLLLGRSERLADPGSLGLEPCGPHAYRRAA
jgi:chemotaxis protein methyltransferase CheR